MGGINLVASAQIFKEMDVDGNGTIELIEFLQAAQKIGGTDYNKQTAMKTFKEVDIDQGGSLDLLEFLDAMNTLANTGSGGLGALGFAQELTAKMGNLRKALQQAEARMKELCENFQEAEDDDNFEKTGEIGDSLVAAQGALDEADLQRQELGDELKKMRAALAEEKRGLAQLGY